MDALELLDWQFMIAKMGRDELVAVLKLMADPESKPFSLSDRDAVDRLERATLIANTEAMLNRPTPSGGGHNGRGRTRTAKVDLSGYYAALSVSETEAQERADRAEVRVMAERRLMHMDARDKFRYSPALSPLQSYINQLYRNETTSSLELRALPTSEPLSHEQTCRHRGTRR